MKFCIIGLKWGKYYLKNLKLLQQPVTCICSRNKANLSDDFILYQHVSDYRQINLHEIDVACICTPPDVHFEMITYFIRHKKNVIVEKPIVFEPDQVSEIQQLANINQVSVMVAYQYLWNPSFLKYKEIYTPFCKSLQIQNTSLGTVLRPEYSLLWDYSSHDLAMTYHIIGNSIPLQIELVNESNSGYSYKLVGNGITVMNDFSLTENSKSRELSLRVDDNLFYFRDDYATNALLIMLSDFISAIEQKKSASNLDLAMRVTQTLHGLSNY